MNILYLHRTQGKGVEKVHIGQLVKALNDLGHSVDIIGPAGTSIFAEENNNGDMDLFARLWGIVSKCIPEFCFEMLEIAYNISAHFKIKKALGEKQYDLIYERYAVFGWAGARLARKKNIPFIMEANYTSFMPLVRKRTKILIPFAHKVDRELFKFADCIVVVSRFLKEHFLSLGVDQKKIKIICNAADPKVFNPENVKDGVRRHLGLGEKKVVGYVGGFYAWHGLDLLLDCLPALLQNNSEIMLLLIGDGPQRKELEERARDMGMEKKVLFLGNIDHQYLPEHIAAFDVAILPDFNDYGSPMKVFEYMAMGKPVVAPRFSSLTDWIDHGVVGFLFEPKNTEELSKVIIALINDEVLRMKLGKQARDKVLKQYTWQGNAESVIDFYQRITNHKGHHLQ